MPNPKHILRDFSRKVDYLNHAKQRPRLPTLQGVKQDDAPARREVRRVLMKTHNARLKHGPFVEEAFARVVTTVFRTWTRFAPHDPRARTCWALFVLCYYAPLQHAAWHYVLRPLWALL